MFFSQSLLLCLSASGTYNWDRIKTNKCEQKKSQGYKRSRTRVSPIWPEYIVRFQGSWVASTLSVSSLIEASCIRFILTLKQQTHTAPHRIIVWKVSSPKQWVPFGFVCCWYLNPGSETAFAPLSFSHVKRRLIVEPAGWLGTIFCPSTSFTWAYDIRSIYHKHHLLCALYFPTSNLHRQKERKTKRWCDQ